MKSLKKHFLSFFNLDDSLFFGLEGSFKFQILINYFQ